MATFSIPPSNRSFLSNNKFEFVLKRIPNFAFFVQSVNLPSLTLQSTSINTPFTAVSLPGNQIVFNQLSLTFIVDEDMQSWYELYNWIYQLGNPNSFDKTGTLTGEPGMEDNTYSDATLFIKTNSNNPNMQIQFYDVYPTELGEMTFSSTEGQEFITSSVVFNYTSYDATKI